MSTKAGALPQNIIDAMQPADRKRLGLKSTDERDQAIEAKAEDDIQRAVEAYCVHLGFEKLIAENIQRAEVRRGYPQRGWQFHLSKLGAKRNPTLPDITLFDCKTGRFLWLELKAKGGKARPLQAVLIKCGFWRVSYSAEEAFGIVQDWLANG